jgi:hypothetical protein
MMKGEKTMKTILTKTAAILAFGIGVMAIYAGSNAILAVWPNLAAVKWLTIYNIMMGLITVVLTAPLIWKNNRFAMTAAASTLGIHSLMIMFLLTLYQGPVSPDSLNAMTTRIIVWSITFTLMIIARWGSIRSKQKQPRTHGLSEQ